jgi:DNA gyrase subunit A
MKDSNYPIFRRAIVEMRLRQLTGLEQDKLRAEYDEIMN